jgi:precorrin-3B synthase
VPGATGVPGASRASGATGATGSSGRSRPDACPGALQTHAAADGGLARIRVPGGRLTSARLRELARAAAECGTGVIELTSRANVQVRGLGEESGLAARMADAGLLPSPTHERVRNILASPLTGCDGRGLLDAGPLVAELDRSLCARPELAALPGRFLFAVDDGRGDVAGLGADAGILPLGPDRAAVLVAGADSGIRVPVSEAVPALLAVAGAFLAELAGSQAAAWRIAELPGGPGRVAARVRAASPTAGASADAGPSASPDAGPGGSGGPVVPRPVTRGPVGVVEPVGGPGDRVALGVAVPLGRLTSAQAELLADLAPEVRLTPWRGVVVPGLSRAEAAEASARLADAGLVTDPDSPWTGVSACTGRPGCAKSLADVRADAAASAAAPYAAAPPGTGTLPVHWAGCERRCGRPAGRVVDVVATGDGYRVDAGGLSLTCADIGQTAAAVAAARGET